MTLASPPTKRSILVTGDVVIDNQIYVGQNRLPGSTVRLGTRLVRTDGGAALLQALLESIAKATVSESASHCDTVQFESFLGLQQPTSFPCLESYAVFEPFLHEPTSDKSGRLWRLQEPLGFGEAMTVDFAHLARKEILDANYHVVVIDDAGLGYRIRTAQSAWPPCLSQERSKSPGWLTMLPEWLVLKLSAPLASGDLWRKLLAVEVGGKRLADRCIVVTSINDLRSEGVQVSHSLSWERTALDLVSEWHRNRSLRSLGSCRYAVIAFQTDGAILADCSDPDKPVFRLLFDPAHLESDWAEKLKSKIFGLQTCLAASVAAHLPLESKSPEENLRCLERGISSGLAGQRRLHLEGFDPDARDLPGFPFAMVSKEILRPTWRYSTTIIPAASNGKRENWTILQGDNASQPPQLPLVGLARRVTLRGTAELQDIPYQQFGDLFVIERSEIESLRSLRRLVHDYSNDSTASKPLSIAVFGPPGAGKSFGVKQIGKAVLGKETPILEFNLAQFADPGEMIGLFHQIRDKVLEGRLPVVFWDEFDTKELYWLQFLLAPMQDGRFQDGQLSRPIGKCIFVFAGGTSNDFQSFSPRNPSASMGASNQQTPDEKQRWEHFKARKGPDFVSRLSGFLNVLGPNQRQMFSDRITRTLRNDSTDVSFPLRRALFVRAKLAKHRDQPLLIDRGVLTALLEVGRYLHGSRSLENILEQLRQSSRSGSILRSDLPPSLLLSLHVEPEEFGRLIGNELDFPGDLENMAKAYHDFYRKQAKSKGWNIVYDREYTDLPDDIKDENRAAAQRVADILSLAGLYLVNDGNDSLKTSDEIKAILQRNLESLAEAEHDGWMEYRFRQGWKKADKRNDELRLHNLLVPFREMHEIEKEKIRHAVLSYPEIVACQGYRIVAEPLVDKKAD
jgi:hypothetical protein